MSTGDISVTLKTDCEVLTLMVRLFSQIAESVTSHEVVRLSTLPLSAYFIIVETPAETQDLS